MAKERPPPLLLLRRLTGASILAILRAGVQSFVSQLVAVSPCLLPLVRVSDIYVASPAHPWALPQEQRTMSGEDDAERAQCPSLPTTLHIPKAGMRQMCEGARAAARVHADGESPTTSSRLAT